MTFTPPPAAPSSPPPPTSVDRPVYPVPPPPPVPTSTASARLVTVHAVNWHNVLDFTQIFRGFRLAINPAKLFLALLAIFLIYGAGRVFDAVWGLQVYSGEINQFNTLPFDQFRTARQAANDRRERDLSRLLGDAKGMLSNASNQDPTLMANRVAMLNALPDARVQELKRTPTAAYRSLKSLYHAIFENRLFSIHEQRIANDKNPPKGDNAKTPSEIEQDSRAAEAKLLLDRTNSAHDAAGRGIFDSFLEYEVAQFDSMVENTLTFVRVSAVRPSAANPRGDPGSAVSGGLISKDPDRLWQSDTVVGCLANMTITAPRWLFSGAAPMQWRPADNVESFGSRVKIFLYRAAYLLSLAAFTLFSLLMLAFTGASIARLSALELSGVERAPLKDVFAFAFRRLWVFVKTPIAPFLIVLVIGIVMGALGLVGALPLIGPLILGVLFFAFLAIAFVVMLLFLGILGGFNLLYPTVAVEGSDAFDAMSRAFAYVYARPWRLFFYTVVSLIYGVITFLFFSFAIYLLLIFTHTFTGWGVNFFGWHYGSYSGLPKMETLWPTPHFARLVSPINWYAMSWPEYFGALFLHFWVFTLITTIGAYVMSYYFSAHTIIYLLLRRSVDGQDIHEVYVDPAPPPTPPAPPAATPGEIAAQTIAIVSSTPTGTPPPPAATPPAPSLPESVPAPAGTSIDAPPIV